MSEKHSAFAITQQARLPELAFEASTIFTCLTWLSDFVAARTLADGLLRRLSPDASMVAFRQRHRRDSYPAQTTRTEAGLAPAGKGTPSWHTITGLAAKMTIPEFWDSAIRNKPAGGFRCVYIVFQTGPPDWRIPSHFSDFWKARGHADRTPSFWLDRSRSLAWHERFQNHTAGLATSTFAQV